MTHLTDNMKPIRIQRSRKHKQVSPNGLPIVYVGRPGKWGNPFPKEKWGIREALSLYDSYIEIRIACESIDISELKGKNLSCWCKIGEPCHADILLKIANQ